MVKFSIVIPVYNSEKYIEECLGSVISQTFKDFEVICINDGSTDASKSLLDEFANKDERVKVYSQENQGVGAARNYGIELAQGKYISFLDSDDILSPNTLKSVYNFFEKHYDEIDVVSIPIFFSNEKNRILFNLPMIHYFLFSSIYFITFSATLNATSTVTALPNCLYAWQSETTCFQSLGKPCNFLHSFGVNFLILLLLESMFKELILSVK